MKYPVSLIPYANVGPYRALGPPPGCEFSDTTPRASTQALKEGRVLAAPVPVGDLPKLLKEVEYLGEYGIAARGEVGSVLFFSDHPFERMALTTRVHLTNHSASSVRLLYLLLGYQNGFDCLPYLAAPEEMAEGELLIGDKALLHASESSRPYVSDLAALWVEKMHLPFVFARWVVRRDAPSEFHKIMLEWLLEFEEREDELVQRAAKAEAARLEMSERKMLAYLQRMQLVLGSEDLRGQKMFLEELAKNEREPLFLEAQAAVKDD